MPLSSISNSMNVIAWGVLIGTVFAIWGLIGIQERIEENEIAYLQKLIDRFNEQQHEARYKLHLVVF